MIELLRNCAHGSEVSTYVVTDGVARRFVKVALTGEGRDALSSEIAGWNWYQSVRSPRREAPICRALRKDRHVVRIEISALDGVHGAAADGLHPNAGLIAKALEQYRTLWPLGADGTAPVHGDLSCDNLIDTADGLFVIDWEHFHPDGAPWGFDALYLLAEALYFHRLRHGAAGEPEFQLVAEQLRRLSHTRRLTEDMQTAPVAWTKRFIHANALRWRHELTRNPAKLPVTQLSDQEVQALDAGIRRAFAGTR